MAKFTIDGRTFTGNRVDIVNGRVTIDGVVCEDTLSGRVEIHILEGVLGELKTNASVNCGTVEGNIDAGGSVNCGNVGGSVDAGGSVNCGNVSGNIDAGGSIRMGR
jgi:hypothetical protein